MADTSSQVTNKGNLREGLMTQTLAEGIKDKEVNTHFKVGRHSVYILYCCVRNECYSPI